MHKSNAQKMAYLAIHNLKQFGFHLDCFISVKCLYESNIFQNITLFAADGLSFFQVQSIELDLNVLLNQIYHKQMAFMDMQNNVCELVLN